MTSLRFQGRAIQLNKKGFLENYDSWSNEVCEVFANSEHLELDEPRWRVIRYLREFYAVMGVPPSPHVLIRDIGEKLAHFHCTHRNIDLLFPGGGCRQACRIAGLPGYFNHSC